MKAINMKVRINNEFMISIVFFLLTLAGSQFCYSVGITAIVEYITFFLLIALLFINRKKRGAAKRHKIDRYMSYIVLLLLIIGLIVNVLPATRRIVLIFTMVVIWMSVFWGYGMITSTKILRSISYAILNGVLLSMLLAVVSGETLITTSEGIFGFTSGFTGGIKYKNYFAADLIAIFMGLYFWGKKHGYKSIDKLTIAFVLVALVFSGSRGGYAIFALFLIGTNFEKINKTSKNQRNILLLGCLFVFLIVFWTLYSSIALKSATYSYRIRGLNNYITYFAGDTFHMLFGNSERFLTGDVDYVYAIRSTVGFDGSLEFAWLDVLVKNGILGVIGFIIIFIRYFRIMLRTNNKENKTLLLAVLLPLLGSSLVETYFQSVHAIFGIFCYLLLSSSMYTVGRERK